MNQKQFNEQKNNSNEPKNIYFILFEGKGR